MPYDNSLLPARPRIGVIVGWITLLAIGLTLGALLSGNTADARSQRVVGVTPTQPSDGGNTVVSLKGTATLTLDKKFLRSINKAKVTVTATSGARRKGSKITFPIKTETAVTTETADIPFKGRLQLRRKGSKTVLRDITLRLRPTGADVGAAIDDTPLPQFAALTTMKKTVIKQDEDGYHYRNLQALISSDLALIAKDGKYGGLTAGANLGLLTAEVAVQ